MKIRTGFVSNSSSSSFVCDVCGENVSGMDVGLSDAEMFRCEHGHTVCDSHKVKVEDEEKEVKPLDWKCPECDEGVDDCYCDEDEDEGEDRYEAPVKFCPICQFKEVDTEEAYIYLLKRCGFTKETLLQELSTKFGTYEKFAESLEEKK